MVIFHSYVSLPEGKWLNLGNLSGKNIGITNMICDCMLAFFGLMSLIQSAGVAKHVHWMICFYDQRWRRDIHFSIHHWWLFTRHFPVIYIYITWLVVWNIFYFPYIGNVIIPTDSYFSEGLVAQPPTRLRLKLCFFCRLAMFDLSKQCPKVLTPRSLRNWLLTLRTNGWKWGD